MPEGKIFVCADACEKQSEPVVMTLEEYETVRLIDHVGLNPVSYTHLFLQEYPAMSFML